VKHMLVGEWHTAATFQAWSSHLIQTQGIRAHIHISASVVAAGSIWLD
jgi:hypothetical protein